MRATSHQHFSTHSDIQLEGFNPWNLRILFENLSSQSSMSSSKCWEQFLFTCNVFLITVTVQGFALMIRGHLGISILTIQTQLLWLHWGEDPLCRGKGGRQVLKQRRTPEHLLLGGFHFTFSNLNVFPGLDCKMAKITEWAQFTGV